MDVCPICLEDMDMTSFNDSRLSTPTCYKLECGHSFHTKCIIGCLSIEGKKCPSCNDHKNPSTELTLQELKRKHLSEIKRDPDIKFLLNELKETEQEYTDSKRQLKKDIKEFIKTRKQELKMDEKRSYVLECIRKIQTNSKIIAKQKGPEYVACLIPDEYRHRRSWGGTAFERHFFGRNKAYHFCRLKNEYIHLKI